MYKKILYRMGHDIFIIQTGITSTIYDDDEDMNLSCLPEKPSDADGALPDGGIIKDKDVVNILLLGIDERADRFSHWYRQT